MRDRLDHDPFFSAGEGPRDRAAQESNGTGRETFEKTSDILAELSDPAASTAYSRRLDADICRLLDAGVTDVHTLATRLDIAQPLVARRLISLMSEGRVNFSRAGYVLAPKSGEVTPATPKERELDLVLLSVISGGLVEESGKYRVSRRGYREPVFIATQRARDEA
jgi:hypothetical protein